MGETVQHLTADDVAERLQIPVWSIYELVKRNGLPAMRIGRRVRFRLKDIEAWEASKLRTVVPAK
jgi:excisionase family DNA binding protein